MGAKYQIYVGRRRNEKSNAVAGFLEKNNSSIIRGEAKEVSVRVGQFGIPNGTQAWGIRLDSKGKRPENPLSVDDKEYRGEVEWLKWGTKGGTMIRARWVPGYDVIDKDYQDLRLAVKVAEGFLDSGEPIALILLNQGFNEFDEETDKGKVQMLKIHHHNDKAISCNPDAEGWMFTELQDEEINRSKTKDIDDKVTCILMVNEASKNHESIKNLFEIVKGAESDKVNRDDANDIFIHLKHFADQQPDIFAQRLNIYKASLSNVFEKAKSFEILDITKDGFVVALDEKKKKEPIFEGIPGKGEAMLDYAFAHFLEPEIFEGAVKLKRITDKLK